MNISQAAGKSGLPVKTLRYYEEIGLVKPGRLIGNDYRDYSAIDVEHLLFLQRTRAGGFDLKICRQLLSIYRDEGAKDSEMKSVLMERIEQVDSQLQHLTELKKILSELADKCMTADKLENKTHEGQFRPSFMSFTLVES